MSPIISVGSLVGALILTSTSWESANADPGNGRDHAKLAAHEDPTELRVLDWVLWYVSKYYVEPSRIDPNAMVLAGLDALEGTIPEALVERLDDGKRVRVHVGTHVREFDVVTFAPWGVGPRLREIFRFVDEHSQLDDEQRRDAEYAMIEGLLATLDPHTNLLRPEDFEDMRTSTKGSFGGLGIEIGMREGKLMILRVMDGNPAAEAGLLAGDQIVQIDDQSAITMSSDDALPRLRGAPGTKVVLHVRRVGHDKPLKFTVTRDVIKLDSVVAEILPAIAKDGSKQLVGYVQIPKNFAQTTGKELREKLQDFEKRGVQGVVLDMRDNPGGLLGAAVEVADAFLGSGTIVSTVGNAQPRDESQATSRYDFPNLPVVVLVDQGSASATEIVAGALRNLDRAVILGRRTFGKGSVQVLHDRRVGGQELALKLTIAQYLTPGDVSIQSVGVPPDLETVPVWLFKDNIFYFGKSRFDRIREESLALHLNNATATRVAPTAGPLYFWDGNASGDSEEIDAAVAGGGAELARATVLLRDPEVRLARDLVVWAPSPRRQEILSKIDDFVETQRDIEDERLRKQLAKRGIDWSVGPAPTAGTSALLETELTFDRPNLTIRGGESGTVTMKVTNKGTAPAFQVRAMSSSDYSYFDERELLFGRLDPGQSRTATLKLSVGEQELTRQDRIDFDLADLHNSGIGSSSARTLEIRSQGLPRPQFAYSVQVLDDPRSGDGIVGNGDGVPQAGEKIELRVMVGNAGPGTALDSWALLRTHSSDVFFVENSNGKLGKLAPGQRATTSFRIEVRKAPPTGSAALTLTVIDNKIGEALSEKMKYEFGTSASVSSAEDGSVRVRGDATLRSSASTTAPGIAMAPQGTVLERRGTQGEWTKVALASGSFAYVSTAAVEDAGKSKATLAGVVDLLSVSPPIIDVEAPPLSVAQESVQIRGKARDEQQLRDLYVTVVNPSRGSYVSDKVYYIANADPSQAQLAFDAKVPLEPGNNLIQVFARENDDVIGVHRLWVQRSSGLEEARAEAQALKAGGKLSVDTLRK